MTGIGFCQHIFRSSASNLLRTVFNNSKSHLLRFQPRPMPVFRQQSVGVYWRLLPYPFLTFGALRANCEEGCSKKCGQEATDKCSPPPTQSFVCPNSFEPEPLPPLSAPCSPAPEKGFTIDLLGLDEGVASVDDPPPSCGEEVKGTTSVTGSVPNFNKPQEDKFSSIFGIQAHQAASEGKNYEPEELTHKFLLKQACSVNVDAVTRVITETMSALESYHTMYREMLKQLMNNLEESRGASERHMELITCRMIVLRSQVEDMRANIAELESFLSSVERLAYATAETAFLAHAEYASIALSERIQSALAEAERVSSTTKDLERDMIQLQTIVIVESGNSLK